jgi:hypothetical protein
MAVTAVTYKRGTEQFRGMFSDMWSIKGTADFANAATGSGTFATHDATVPGVALGDIVLGVSCGVDTVDAVVIGAVTAANTVTLTLLNNTAGAVDLASTTVKFVVARPAW